ncbi:MAG: hypothetical protein KDA84_04245 [Planctomycetaceae bacterium]|nr:hypothetical protein [Planctomycetaceae bacterium]
MSWHKPYNISGTIHVEDRLEVLMEVVGQVLRIPTESVGLIGHFTGATTIIGQGDVGMLISTGFDLQNFYALVLGDRKNWINFARQLGELLTMADFPYSVTVHQVIINEEK